jgi:hypothetical protein
MCRHHSSIRRAESHHSHPLNGYHLKAAMLFITLLFAFAVNARSAEHAYPPPMINSESSGQVPHSLRTSPLQDSKVDVYLFWGEGCTHCEEEKRFLAGLSKEHRDLDIREYEVLHDRRNLRLLSDLMKVHGRQTSGVPITFIGSHVFEGFSRQIQSAMERTINECRKQSCTDPADLLKKGGYSSNLLRPNSGGASPLSFHIPFLGTLDVRSASLPVLTIAIAGMDSFNPCAFFVLLSLLGLLVHGGSRNKMLIVGGVFVFISGFIYFLCMTAWLNLFLVMGNVSAVTMTAGVVSLVIATINIKDFFIFKKGLSLTIPDSAKPRLFSRIRDLLRSTSFLHVIAGTMVLAIMANFYELLCTAGFPMVFTRILTLDSHSALSSYLYLLLYNVVRVIPLFVIVLGFTITLSSRKLTEQHARILKLVSGTMMLGLGTVLVVHPVLLNSLLISFVLVAGAVCVSLLLAAMTRRLGYL